MGITFLRASISDWKDRKEECQTMLLENSPIVNKEYWEKQEEIADKRINELEKELKSAMDRTNAEDLT
jgi:hypothetical protein